MKKKSKKKYVSIITDSKKSINVNSGEIILNKNQFLGSDVWQNFITVKPEDLNSQLK